MLPLLRQGERQEGSVNYSDIIKAQLRLAGKPFTVNDGDEEKSGWAVIEQTWRKNKSRFEENSSKIGRYYRDYYNYIGPYDIDIKELSDGAVVLAAGEKFYFVQKERVSVGGYTQYYRGILKKAEEVEEDAFTQSDG